MSTFISEPGTRLGGRYRLEDRVRAGDGWAVWKAIDETLARAVTVLTFAQGFPRITETVTAARAASRLTDARLAQVFDVEEDWDHAYVVMEWVGGDSLDDLLADGPLDPRQGGEIIEQGAEALAAAHDAGVAHLCLTPGCVRWTAGGGVKITGLGVDAALAGVTADDPALADTQGLGRLLYAALTAHWPGGEWPSLPAAPEVDGHPRSPRQVRAGVPAGIDGVCCQVLLPGAAGGPITTSGGLAEALTKVIPAPAAPPPLPEQGSYTAGMDRAEFTPGLPYQQQWPGGTPRRRGSRAETGRRPLVATKVMASIAVVLVAAAVGVGVWTLGQHNTNPRARTTPTQSPSHSAPPATVLTPVSAAAFGPNGGDNGAEAPLAIDREPGTDWTTDSYQGSSHFGNLYHGTGLVLNMGKQVSVSSVQVTFGLATGSHVRIEVGDNDSGVKPAGTTTLGRSSNATGTITFTAHHTATGQFVFIWFTNLASQQGSPGHYQADVFNVVVRGSS
jgi:serine/threonine protein kinase